MEFENETKKARDFIKLHRDNHNVSQLAFHVNIEESLEQSDAFWAPYLRDLHQDTPIVGSMRMTARVFNRIANNNLKTNCPRSGGSVPQLATGRVVLYVVKNENINSLKNNVEKAEGVVSPFEGMHLPYTVWIPKEESFVSLDTRSDISNTHLKILKDLGARLPFQMRSLAELDGDQFNHLLKRHHLKPLGPTGFGIQQDVLKGLLKKSEEKALAKSK